MSKIPELHEKVLKQASSPALGKYVWKYGLGPQMGYSFSIIHALAYSFVGMQTLYLATNFNPIYWNTACLIVNSGSLEDSSEEEIINIYEQEKEEIKNGTTYEDLPDRSGKIKKTSSTDYAKVAKAIGAIQKANIKIGLVNINKSQFGFIPDVENNQILFGLKGMLHVGDDVVKATIENRPYVSIKDYVNKVNPNKQAMVSLIKGGAFDTMMDRKLAMGWYLWETCDKKKNITMQNLASLIKYNMLPQTEDGLNSYKSYEFNRYLKMKCKFDKIYYLLDSRAISFLEAKDLTDFIMVIDGHCLLEIKTWDKIYQSYMAYFKTWINDNQDTLKEQLNKTIFKEDWEKYAKGNISSWEMEVLCFYYHDHELKNANMSKYGFLNFFDMPEEPIIENSFETKDRIINKYKISKICGTCIAKNKTKSTVSLLTLYGVVDVKFSKEFFAMFDKKISTRLSDGTKKTLETSWFDRGSMIAVQGFRRDDSFIPKKYSSSGGHLLYKIDGIYPNGDLNLRSSRVTGDIEEE